MAMESSQSIYERPRMTRFFKEFVNFVLEHVNESALAIGSWNERSNDRMRPLEITIIHEI